MYLEKLIFLLHINARMLKKLAHEAILLTFSRMEPVYFVFIKFNSHLLQIRKVAGRSFLQNSWRLLAINYFRKKLQP